MEQVHQTPDASEVRTLQISACKEKDESMDEMLEWVKTSLLTRTKQAVELATEHRSIEVVDSNSHRRFELQSK